MKQLREVLHRQLKRKGIEKNAFDRFVKDVWFACNNDRSRELHSVNNRLRLLGWPCDSANPAIIELVAAIHERSLAA